MLVTIFAKTLNIQKLYGSITVSQNTVRETRAANRASAPMEAERYWKAQGVAKVDLPQLESSVDAANTTFRRTFSFKLGCRRLALSTLSEVKSTSPQWRASFYAMRCQNISFSISLSLSPSLALSLFLYLSLSLALSVA